MNKSAAIRQFAREGLSTAEIARRLGIRYQFAYNVLNKLSATRAVGKKGKSTTTCLPKTRTSKPKLSIEELVQRGFQLSGHWVQSESRKFEVDRKLPSAAGVYAFATHQFVDYVGLATMGLAKRIDLYRKPGATQTTNIRLNEIIEKTLKNVSSIGIYTVEPADLEWNGFPVHTGAGLELGLIRKYDFPWNKRGS